MIILYISIFLIVVLALSILISILLKKGLELAFRLVMWLINGEIDEEIDDEAIESYEFENLNDSEFQYLVARILRKLDYIDIKEEPAGASEELIVTAKKDGQTYAFFCKKSSSFVNKDVVENAYKNKYIYGADTVIVVTDNFYSEGALRVAEKYGITLWDRTALSQLIAQIIENERLRIAKEDEERKRLKDEEKRLKRLQRTGRKAWEKRKHKRDIKRAIRRQERLRRRANKKKLRELSRKERERIYLAKNGEALKRKAEIRKKKKEERLARQASERRAEKLTRKVANRRRRREELRREELKESIIKSLGGMTKRKRRDLFIITIIYILAFVCGYFASKLVEGTILKYSVFDTVATIVTFIFSVILRNSSVYDAYWSLTPMVMSIYLFVSHKAFSVYQILFLVAFNIWSLRLTLNWVTVFTDFSYEDWRYRMFRDKTPKLLWPLVNFFGIHYMPTLIVFAGMLPIFEIAHNPLGLLSIPGMLIILLGVLFELLADIDMHRFLSSGQKGSVCKTGLWRYSRHPNYLGEIVVWLGVYITMLPYSLNQWYLGIGFVCVFVMFNIISIPLMEKRQKARRPDFEAYCKETSRLLILPPKRR